MKEQNYTLIYFRIGFIILLITSLFFIHNTTYYPHWGHGDKVLKTTANVIEVYRDDTTGDVYSHIEFNTENKYVHKWFQIELSSNDKPIVYYNVENPIKESRLTNPLSKEEQHKCAFFWILSCVFVSAFFITFIPFSKLKSTQKNKKKK